MGAAVGPVVVTVPSDGPVAVPPPVGKLLVGCGTPWLEFGEGGLIVLEFVPCANTGAASPSTAMDASSDLRMYVPLTIVDEQRADDAHYVSPTENYAIGCIAGA